MVEVSGTHGRNIGGRGVDETNSDTGGNGDGQGNNNT